MEQNHHLRKLDELLNTCSISSWGTFHKKHENVICRKANKRTEFLDLLRKAIFEESKKKGYL